MRQFKLKDSLLFSFLFFAFTTFAQENATAILAKAESLTNPDSSLILYEKAYQLSVIEKNDQLTDSISFSLARRYIGMGQLDTARSISKERLRKSTPPDSNRMASGFYNLIAATFHHQNKLDSASIYYLKAIKLLEQKNDTLKAAKLRFNLANIFLSYMDYEQAAKEFENTVAVMKRYKDSAILSGALSTLATCKIQLNEAEAAKKLTAEALNIALIRNDYLGQMLSYRQFGQIAEHEIKLDSSLIYYNKAYDIALLTKSSYYISMLEMNLCEIYAQLGDPINSLEYCTKSLEASQNNQFKSHLKSLYTNLSKAYELNGDFKNAFLYLNKAVTIREEELNEKNKEIVNELMIKYETEKKDKRILEQKLEIIESERESFIYGTILIFAFIGIGVLSLLYYYRNKLNKAKIAQINQAREQEILKAILNGEEGERNRLAADLHDGISNLLFSCKLSLSALKPQETNIKLKIDENVSLIDDIREESRRMSHNLMPPNLSENKLEVIFHDYVNRMNESTSRLSITFQSFGEQSIELDDKIKLLLYRSMQELIGNALKYAHASEIDLQLFYHPQNISISIADNGVGFDPEETQKGKGLKSLLRRLGSINATIDIDSKVGEGTTITINLPK